MRKLDELKRYDENEIITAEYNQNDLDEAYYAAFEDAYELAQRIKERVETVLMSARLDDKPVLTSEVDRNGKIKYSGHSTKTIIDILSNSDKISFYPWRKTLPERNVFPTIEHHSI